MILSARFIVQVSLAVVAASASVAACSGASDMGDAHARAQSGYSVASDGLSQVDMGLASYQSGRTADGLAAMHGGMEQMVSGASTLRAAFSSMPGGMMGSCSVQGRMMGAMDEGISGIRTGLGMMGDGVPSDVTPGMGMVQRGMRTATGAMGMMGASLSCCGNGKTMGMMP